MDLLHPKRPLIFISYSHHDDKWLEAILEQLKPLRSKNLLDCWSDKEIETGAQWKKEIEQALITAQVAVLLVSPKFLASDFIEKNELPPLLNAAKDGKLKIIWIPISSSMYKHTQISDYQAACDPKQPLDTLAKPKRSKVLVGICEQILASIEVNNNNTRQQTSKINLDAVEDLQTEIDYDNAVAFSIRPILMIVYRRNGWHIQNKGRGVAFNIIIAQKHVKGHDKGTWFNPVRVPTLGVGEELCLIWLRHENETGLGASYEDEEGRPFTSVTSKDLTTILRNKVFPQFTEQQIRRHWQFF